MKIEYIYLIFSFILIPWSILAQQEEEFDFFATEPVITRLDGINSSAAEKNPVITADGRILVFMSQRGGRSYNQRYGERFDSDIFLASRTDIESNKWPTIRRFNTIINNELDQDEPFISADGNTLTYQSWSYEWEEDGGPYYEIRLKADADNGLIPIGQPQPLGRVITQFLIDNRLFATDGLTRTANGSLLFVAGQNYSDPMDIYYAKRLANGQFLTPTRLNCNTSFDERSVFLSGDQTTLYFASDRAGGKGGLDIYKVAFDIEKGRTDTPINISSHYNTESDEYGFVMYRPDEAFFIRDGNIYSAKNNSVEAIVIAATEPDTEGIQVPIIEPEPAIQADIPIEINTDTENTSSIGQPMQTTRGTSEEKKPSIIFSATNNVVLALDVSSSMDEADRLPLLSNSVLQMLPSLRKRDKVSMIAFSDEVRVKLNGTDGSLKSLISTQLNSLKVGGKTNGIAALSRALKFATAHKVDGNNLVIMATDGKMSYKKVKSLMKKYKKNGIQLIVLSYGNPDSKIQATLDEITKITNGYHISINQNNVDAEILRALGGKLNF